MKMARGLDRLHAHLRRDPEPVVALAVGMTVLVVLALTAGAGLVRDEGYYFRAAREYHAWFEGLWRSTWAGHPAEAFTDATLTRAFGYNTEHPGFVKLLMGFTWKIAHGWLGTSERFGFRLASMLVVAVGAAFTHLLGARLWGRAVGLVAVALYFACPHVFYHAHIGAFDGPIAALTVIATYAFWRSLDSSAWICGAGVAFGVALATKHNAVFLVPTLGVAYALSRSRQWRWSNGLALPPLPLAFVAMVALGPPILYLCYPFGWHAPLARLGAYYAYHLGHENYPVDYFGTLYREPPFPWSFPWVMSAITVPLPILVAGLCGGVLVLRRALGPDGRERDGAWQVLLGALVPPFIISLPTVPIFGGTKHWLPGMPFFALAAALALVEGGRAVAALGGRRARLVAVALVVLPVALGAAEIVRTHPLEHTDFNELVLGHQGGAALGMPRGFWGGAGGGLLPTLNALAGPGELVFTHRMNLYDFEAYQRDGLIRADLRWTDDLGRAQWALAYHQREHQDVEYECWRRAGDRRPTASLAIDGVPIVSLYQLGRRATPAPVTLFAPPPP
jgi:4-amino-4-deoxy-L-arabinose transferase-like glycosyltransferase